MSAKALDGERKMINGRIFFIFLLLGHQSIVYEHKLLPLLVVLFLCMYSYDVLAVYPPPTSLSIDGTSSMGVVLGWHFHSQQLYRRPPPLPGKQQRYGGYARPCCSSVTTVLDVLYPWGVYFPIMFVLAISWVPFHLNGKKHR